MLLLLAMVAALAQPEGPPDAAPAAVIELVQPPWPAGAEGIDPVEVRALVHIDPDGHATAVVLPSDLPAVFRPALRDALLSSRYTPARVGGAPTVSDLEVTVTFVPPDDAAEFVVVTRGPAHPEADRGIGDHRIDLDAARAVESAATADALKLAPSVFVARVGGSLHPEQIFLRGFDARHGQDLAVRVDGVPLNQVGNPYGHGLVDLHSVPAEAVRGLRVQQGPFDPAQGDFAVAGSLDLELGLPEPGLLLRAQGGSFGTGRAVVGWRHAERRGTFAVGELFHTEGYGANRSARKGSALVRADGGERELRWFVLGSAYGSSYRSAGLVRQQDVDAGRIDLYGTQDPHQGGSAGQALAAAGLSGRVRGMSWRMRTSAAARHQRIRANLTGFLADDRRAGESQHPQRGDLTEHGYAGTTLALDADVEQTARDLPAGLTGGLRAGVNGRYDDVDAYTWRVADLDRAPYRVEADHTLRHAHLGLHAEGELGTRVFTVRAGARSDLVVTDLLDRCGAKDAWFPGAQLDDVNCPDANRNGPRLRSDARTAAGIALSPRASALLRPWPHHTFTAAAGRGFRSLEAPALSEGEASPVASLWGAELGWGWTQAADWWTGLANLAAFTTHVDRDLVFDEVAVRNIVAGETHRVGASAVGQLQVGPFTARGALTYTYAVFGDELAPSVSRLASDRQPGQLVPYVPPWVGRVDLVAEGPVGAGRARLDSARLGLAADWISPRPLPQSERSQAVFTVDLQASARKGPVELGLTLTNALNARYPLAEYAFASWFPATSGQPFPTRIASRQISPGAPRAALATLTVRPGVSP